MVGNGWRVRSPTIWTLVAGSGSGAAQAFWSGNMTLRTRGAARTIVGVRPSLCLNIRSEGIALILADLTISVVTVVRREPGLLRALADEIFLCGIKQYLQACKG